MAAAPSEDRGQDGRPTTGLALYRRYRPATFAEVKGQDHVTAPLRQALSSGRINHAYLFSGPRGCGKTSSARILARSLNCVNGPTPDPCGVCDSCVALAPSGPGSIDVIEIDAASHGGVDDARDLRERAFYSPVAGRFKIYIIDEAHMVTQQGFNALLKLVEEPPPHLKFIFATTEPEKVIPTIRSRTHHYPFRLVPPSVLRELLEEILANEGVPFDPAVLPLVVRAGAGSARDSLSILDQLLAGSDETGLRYDRAVALLGYTDASLLDEVVDAFAAADGAAVFRAVNRVIEGGHEPRRFAMDLLDRLRDLIVLASVPDAVETGLLDVPPDRAELMSAQAQRFGQAGLTRAAEIISTGLDQMRGATSPRLLLELMCAQVLLPAAGTDERSLLARLERLEAGVPHAAAGSPPVPAVSDDSERRAGPRSGTQATPPPRDAKTTERPAPASQDAEPADGADTPAPATPRPASGVPAGEAATADALRQGWDGVLDAIRAQRRVAWMLLSNASVVSLDDGVLILRFPRPGDVKGFVSSGYEELLKQVLTARFGLNVTVRAVSGGDKPAAERRGARPGPAQAPPEPSGPGGAQTRPAGSGPADAGSGTGVVTAAAGGAKERSRRAVEPFPDDEPPPADDGYPFSDDDGAPAGGASFKEVNEASRSGGTMAASAPAELTGMDLIQRELGGQIISEIED
jgi:DNA polymerase III subunit gamma/tau